jgi:tetratricopeptide (TPR) repeat protein
MDFFQHLGIAFAAETVVKAFFEFIDLIGKNLKGDQGFLLISGGDGVWGDETPQEYELMVHCLDAEEFEKANEYANELVKKYPKDPRSYLSLGTVNLFIGHIREAFENLKKAEKYIKKIKDDEKKQRFLLELYSYLGLVSIYLGNMEEAQTYLLKSLELAEKLGEKKSKVDALVNIGLIYSKNQDYEKAEESYKKAIELTDSEYERAVIYNNLAHIYMKKKEPDKAIEYFKKSVKIDKIIGDKKRAGEHMLNLGMAYAMIGDLENAKKYLDEGLELAKQTRDKFWEAMGYRYVGGYNVIAGNLKEGKKYLLKSYDMFRYEIGNEDLANTVLKELNQIRQIRT